MKRIFTDLYTRIVIRFKYRRGFIACNEVITLGRKIMSSHDKGMVWDHANLFSKVLIFALAQNIHRLQSVKALAAKGLAKDAIPLIRCMFEDFADVQYMFSNKETVRDFVDYGIRLQIQSGEGLLASNADFDRQAIEKNVAALKKKWEQVKSRFIRTDGKVHSRWNKKSVEQTCRDVGLEESYNTSYRYFSGFVHLSALNVNNYVEGMTDDGRVSVTVGTSEAMVNEALHVAAGTFIGLLGIANEEHKMGYEQEIEKTAIKLRKKN